MTSTLTQQQAVDNGREIIYQIQFDIRLDIRGHKTTKMASILN